MFKQIFSYYHNWFSIKQNMFCLGIKWTLELQIEVLLLDSTRRFESDKNMLIDSEKKKNCVKITNLITCGIY